MDISQISSQLSSSPKRFSDCCLAISNTFVTNLIHLLPKKPAFTLSIGSGSGLLEALLTRTNATISVEGVEVASTVNHYIAEEDMHVTGGAWDLHSRAQQAAAWMFVYPRQPRLITKYIEAYGDESIDMIVWLGPKSLEDVGLAPYETAVVARRST
ncbi:uncharacterized protein N7482_001968 [Penicillium canariense]|uniref:Uncharacterized protein n=1 Tax=Penicillium canariense TaxID=189055 RepID=A0A9W9LTL4_9EURO|nr:uncharacterized protein N7482_001968 [Penicillium canariense]KAJ5176091.1 hypothetical protein N7482_001968 [Penicillium canariense]